MLTENRSRILSARPTADGVVVRVHRCFAAAPVTVMPALATLIAPAPASRRRRSKQDARARRAALALVRAYFEANTERSASSTNVTMPKGRFFDLEALRDEINRAYFEDRLTVAITWGRWGTRRRRARTASIRLGSYDPIQGLVRIHPTLDAEDVPRYVVASVVHHEMLHAALPPRSEGGRRVLHGPDFRRRERQFRDHARAERWIARHLDRLLVSRSARRSGR